MSLDIYKTFLGLCCYFQKCVEEKEDKSVSLDYYVFPPSYYIIITNRMIFEVNQGILMWILPNFSLIYIKKFLSPLQNHRVFFTLWDKKFFISFSVPPDCAGIAFWWKYTLAESVLKADLHNLLKFYIYISLA